METNNQIKVGDNVYLLVSPTNRNSYYRYEKCIVTNIIKYKEHYTTENIKSIRIPLINDINDIMFSLDYESSPGKYHTLKRIDRIYLLDEFEILLKDIDKLNNLLEFKTKQKQELKNYVSKLKIDWDYRGKLNI